MILNLFRIVTWNITNTVMILIIMIIMTIMITIIISMESKCQKIKTTLTID
jgi:hypothetical protein